MLIPDVSSQRDKMMIYFLNIMLLLSQPVMNVVSILFVYQ
jgi:hypothetical protein